MKKVVITTLALVALTGCASKSEVAEKQATQSSFGSVLRVDPALDALVPKDATIEKVAGGFEFTEGPLWFPAGYLWFSDVKGNVVRQWSPSGVSEILRPGGYESRMPRPDRSSDRTE